MTGERRVPWWLSLTLGVACVVLGVILIIRPFTSLGVLVALVAASFMVTGISDLAGARQAPKPSLAVVTGAAWIAVGLAAAVWSGITIHAVAILVGVSMVIGGLVKLVIGIRGRVDERLISVTAGLASVVFGVLALAWTDVTVLVLALFVGARTVLFGFGVIGAALGRGRSPSVDPDERSPGQIRRAHWRRGLSAGLSLLLALVLLLISALVHSGAPSAEAFYAVSGQVPAQPGVLLRTEPFTRGIPQGARAWRILYTTTRDRRVPALASAVVVAAADLPPGPRPVIAWAHGTTGIVQGCAPSILKKGLDAGALPVLSQVIARGWVLVATDYIGLGTKGPHPYLIGQGEARSVLDSVRAAMQMKQLELANRIVVWGHSQGGHAALWTGIVAPSYAPQLNIVGVAALAPASDLTGLLPNLSNLTGGEIFASYVIGAYSENYDDVGFDTYVRPQTRIIVRSVASRCLAEPAVLVSVLTSLPLKSSILGTKASTGALGQRLHENTPAGHIDAPLLIAQGEADSLVRPAVQARFVKTLCAAGQSLQYRVYPGRDHLGVVADDSPLIPELLSWTEHRIQGRTEPPGCRRFTG